MAPRRTPPIPPAPIPEVSWQDFGVYFAGAYRPRRENAEHVTIMGPTGTGKSTLAMWVASHRRYVVALVAKPKDSEMRRMLRRGRFVKVDELPDGGVPPKVFIWPANRGDSSYPAMAKAFAAALDNAFRAGSWHVVIDEGAFFCERLKLHLKIKDGYQMGRSLDQGLIVCGVRPAYMPHDIYSSATHLFFFGTNDSNDIELIGGLNGVNNHQVRDTVATLGKTHRFLYVNTATGYRCISKMEQ